MWGATRGGDPGRPEPGISIHAPRVGSDHQLKQLLATQVISIHAPRVGSDESTDAETADRQQFQSTLPVWGATVPGGEGGRGSGYFNPRSPCGERQPLADLIVDRKKFQSTLPVWGATALGKIRPLSHAISIHAPRVGSDGDALYADALVLRFQSTLPVWGATWTTILVTRVSANFNPRSPCGERPERASQAAQRCNFNPRSPCGERPNQISHRADGRLFQSTLPVWGATSSRASMVSCWLYFNPRSPCGERLHHNISFVKRSQFQSTLPVWGATAGAHQLRDGVGISIQAPRVGSDGILWS